MTKQSPRPTVLVVSLGGTIAMTPSEQDGAAHPTLSAEDLLAAVPQLAGTDIDIKMRPKCGPHAVPALTFALHTETEAL